MSGEKREIVLDTSVILNFSERVATKREDIQTFLFDKFEVYSTPMVIEEATRASINNLAQSFIQNGIKIIHPDYNKLDFDLLFEMNEMLDKGEVEVVTCCMNSGFASSLDDLAAIKFGRKHGIINFGTIVLLKYAYDNRAIDSTDAGAMISEMRNNGAYFKDMKDLDFDEYYKKYLK